MIDNEKVYEFIISPQSKVDLIDSHDYYELQRYGLGNEFVIEVDSIINRIIT